MKGTKHKTLVELAKLNPETTEESLIKAMNKEGLVQKEVTVQRRNGTTFTRKQWVRASKVKEPKSPKGKKGGGDDGGNKKNPPDKKDKTAGFDLDKFNSIKSDRTAAIDYLKESGITWKEHEQKGINWMRAMMAAKEQTGISNITAKDSSPGKYGPLGKNRAENNSTGKTKESHSNVVRQRVNKHIDKLVKEEGRDGVMKLAKEQGITWKENKHEGVNWMHARVALRQYLEQSENFIDDKKYYRNLDMTMDNEKRKKQNEEINREITEKKQPRDSITAGDNEKIQSRIKELDKKKKSELIELAKQKSRLDINFKGLDKYDVRNYILESEFGKKALKKYDESRNKPEEGKSKSKRETPAKSSKKSKPVNWSKKLEHLETMDFQGRGNRYPKPNIPDSIQVVSNDGSSATVYGSFKNTDEQTAKKYMENYIKNELRDYLNKLEIVVDSQQSGDYHNDWVDVSVIITPKKTK